MRNILSAVLLCLLVNASAQAQQRPDPATPTDVYHVTFMKATPGQAAALLANQQKQITGNVLWLRHAEGAGWDYCIIQHLGKTATVSISAPTPNPNPNQAPQAWHEDTYVAGPSWAEFSKSMNVQAQQGVFVVSTHRQVPGRRSELLAALAETDPNAKVQAGHVILQHIDGGPWTFLTIDRYNSWQDFAADRAANPSGGKGWMDVRQYSAEHQDSLAELIR